MAFADSLFKISPLWSFKTTPLDAVESFKKMAAAIHKNPSFEKWLEKNAKERAERKKSLVLKSLHGKTIRKNIFVMKILQ